MARRSPGTDVTEVRKGPITAIAIATAIGGFLGLFEKGELNKPILVTSPSDAKEVVGDSPPDTDKFTQNALIDFFTHGGQSAYLVRVLGSGYASASRMLQTIATGSSSGSLSSNVGAFPVALVNGETFIGKVDGGGAVTATVVANRARVTGAGATYAAVTAAHVLNLLIQGVARQVVFDGTENTQAKFLTAINTQLVGATAVDSSGQIRIISDREGSSSSGSVVNTTSADVLTSLGLTAGAFTLAGGSNVSDVSAVTAAELLAIFNTSFVGSTSTAPVATQLTWTTNTVGALGSVQLSGGTGVSKIAGFDNAVHAGAGTTPVNALQITASSPGAWGNKYRVKSLRSDTTVAKVAASHATGEVVDTLALNTTSKVSVGDTLRITDAGGNIVRGVVESLDGNNVTFVDSVTVTASGWTSSTNVVNETFTVYVYDKNGKLERTFSNLRTSSLAGANYVENAINNASRTPITATIQVNVALDKRPSDDASPAYLSGGSEGAALVDADYIGALGSPKTGLYAFDYAGDVNMISVPGNTSTDVVKALETYGEYRQDVVMFGETPVGYDRDTAKTWIESTVNAASSFSSFWFPWVKRRDPVTLGLKKYPNSGIIQGIVARTHKNRGFGKAPAGIVDGLVLGVLDLEFNIDDNDYEVLYPAKINAIRNFPGEGICAFGNTTSDATGEFGSLNKRIIFNIVKREIKKRTRWVNFEPNTKKTRDRVVRTIKAYLRSLKDNGGSGPGVLVGENDDDAFFIQCDDNNNTPLVVSQKKLVCRIGLATQTAAEFQEYTLEEDTRAIDASLALDP